MANHKAIIRKANQGEINFPFQDFTHIMFDFTMGLSWALTEKFLKDNNLSEGDIVNYQGEIHGGRIYAVVKSVDQKLILN
jgi:hypothetical protein